jgi:hypothetical protein
MRPRDPALRMRAEAALLRPRDLLVSLNRAAVEDRLDHQTAATPNWRPKRPQQRTRIHHVSPSLPCWSLNAFRNKLSRAPIKFRQLARSADADNRPDQGRIATPPRPTIQTISAPRAGTNATKPFGCLATVRSEPRGSPAVLCLPPITTLSDAGGKTQSFALPTRRLQCVQSSLKSSSSRVTSSSFNADRPAFGCTGSRRAPAKQTLDQLTS